MAKHLSPPLSRQSVGSSRKYQQRLRWQRLPPTVPMLRICGPPIMAAAVGGAGKCSSKGEILRISARVVSAAINNETGFPDNVSHELPFRPQRAERLTT